MRLISWTLDNLGNQDRSLSADAVFGTIEIVKETDGGDATFGYSTAAGQGGGGLPDTFDLATSGGTASRGFAVVGGGKTYTVAESSLPEGWEFDDLVCSDPDNGDQGTSVDLETRTATIVVNGSEQIVCTFTNELAKLTPTVTTEIHNAQHAVITSAPIGSTVHDEAVVSGAEGTPTGTVDFRVWLGNTTCSAESSSAGNDVTLVNGIAHPSDPIVVPAGGLSFRAQYDGDSTYDDEDGPCEPLTPTKLTPTINTDVHDAQHAVITSTPIGSTVHDKASVSGSATTPTGTVDFTVWHGNTNCSGEGSSAGTDVALVGGVADPSASKVVPANGLSFRAHYDGDSVYNPGDGPCEPLAALSGTIIVEKQTVPNGAAGSFGFSGDAAGTIGDNGQIVVNGLAPGTYTSTEAPTAGFSLTAISCDDANSSGDLGARTATFRVEAGEIVRCILTNAKPGIGSITVSKSASPTTIQEPGGPVTFSVTITNTSVDVVVTIDNVVDDKFGDLDDAGGNGCFDVPINLAPGQKVNCTFQRQITGVGGTSHVNTVTVSGHDPAGNQLTASDDARVDITPRLIDLVIVKEASSPTPLNGVVNYSLTVTNKGPDSATNVQLADPAPAGITYLTANPSQGTCSLSPALVTCALGTIAPGQTVTIAITARATTVGSHTNTATVTGAGGRETNPADNIDSAVTVVPAPLRPPTVKPTPQPEFCLALTVSPQMIKADGKPDKVTVKVTAGSKRVKGAKVVVSGAGVRKSATSNGKGLAVLRINPKKAGIITITALETNQQLCGPKRIGVVGVFLPPLTG